MTSPIRIRQDTYEQLLKDPLYGRLAKIAVEIGEMIVVNEGEICKTVRV